MPTQTATRAALYGTDVPMGEPEDHTGRDHPRQPQPAGRPAPAAAPSQPKTQPITVGSLLAEITSLRGDIAGVRAQLEATTKTLALLLARSTPAAAPAPAAAPSQARQAEPELAGPFRDFVMTAIRVGASERDGSRTYKAVGKPFTQFGIKIWPEVLPELGVVNPEALKFGDTPVRPLQVRAAVSAEGSPRKIIGLAPAPAVADDEVPF